MGKGKKKGILNRLWKWNFKIGRNLGVSQLILCAAGWILTDGFVLTGLDLTVDGFWFLQEFGGFGHCKRYKIH